MSDGAPGDGRTKILALEEGAACRWCGEEHGAMCPWVKALEFSAGDERVTRVEFLVPADYPKQRHEQDESEADYPRKPAAN